MPCASTRVYLKFTALVSPRPRSLFVCRVVRRVLYRRKLSFFLRKVIVDSDAVMNGSILCTHSI